METMSDRELLALYRVAKTRGRAFFRDPRAMVALRRVVRERGLIR